MGEGGSSVLLFLAGFLVPLFNIVGCMWGGYYCLAGATLVLFVIPLLDTIELAIRQLNYYLQGCEKVTILPPKPVIQAHSVSPHIMLLWFFLPLNIIALLYSAKVFGELETTWEKLALINSMSCTGTFGLTTTHELCHKRDKISQAVAVMGTALVLNPDFIFDHASMHHPYAATLKDSQTALLGEDFYTYVRRSMTGVSGRHWGKIKIIYQRFSLEKIDKLVGWFAGVLVTIFTCFQLGGFSGLFLLLSHAAVARWFMEVFGYTQHYGMMRRILPNGEYEPINLLNTAWDTDYLMSNIFFWRVGYHTEHHVTPHRVYKEFGTTTPMTVLAPKLPMGLISMNYLALIPSLWFYVMNHRVIKHREMLDKMYNSNKITSQ